ncbi:MAG: AtpZ/AtpI family protein [Chitinophagaceae bacterium]
MITVLLIAYFAGNWLDKKNDFRFPIFTVIFLLVSIIGLLIKIIKDTSNKK